MVDPEKSQGDGSVLGDTDHSRLHLIWDVLTFQLKLAADGLRDVLLSPISLISAVMGLVVGGDEPDRYFKQVLKLGRRSEIWLNLFGYRKHAGTSDELLAPLKDKVFAEAQKNPWASKAGSGLNKQLDAVNATLSGKTRKTSTSVDEQKSNSDS